MEDNNNKPTVFISYSHKDEKYKDMLLPHLKVLSQSGRIIIWDDRNIDVGDKWYPEIEEAMSNAAIAVCLISHNFLSSDFISKEEVPFLLERCNKKGMHIIPILVHPCLYEIIDWVQEVQMIPRDGKSISEDFKGNENGQFKLIAKRVFEIIDNPGFKPIIPTIKFKPPEKVDIYRLPQTGQELFGRQKEIAMLNEAWESGETNIISFVAWGGVGKSTLINEWVKRMRADNFRGAERIFAWSFYSQGTNDRVTSADTFLNDALEWFGDPDPKEGSVWAKGERLAELVNEKRTLLLLDGLEPLQSGYDFEKGKVKDAGLAMLLKRLAKKNRGLCVVTTREPISDLMRYETTVKHIDLEQISPEAGRALLRVGGVNGTDGELENAVKDFDGHALAISLLSAWLKDMNGHHIKEAGNITDLDITKENGKHPRRIIVAFEEMFGAGADNELLQILGLFDRPANIAAINTVKEAPAIKGLTDELQTIDEAGFNKLCDGLRRLKLIAPASEHNPDVIDCHPLIREHFSEKLNTINFEAYKEAHNRLYEYYCNMPEKEQPDTLEAMGPLFVAIAHGCNAGKYQEVLNHVYNYRIQRGGVESYCCKKLGAFGTDLAVLSNFFDILWAKPAAGLNDSAKVAVLNWAGFRLFSLNRLREAAVPMRAGLLPHVLQENWENAAAATSNLCELHLALGDTQKAVEYGRQCVEYAGKSGNGSEKENDYATLADALHQAGDVHEAEELFLEAEKMQKNRMPNYIYLYSVCGFKFCDQLLSKGLYDEVLNRAKYTLNNGKDFYGLLSEAQDTLTLGRAYLAQTVENGSNDFTLAEDYMNRAVDGLRNAGTQYELPRGFLARAALYREQKQFGKARADLDEAYEIAEMGEQRLHLTDYYLESCRLFLAEGKGDEARVSLDKAKGLIEETGYGRRIPEAEQLGKELGVQ